MIGLLAFLWLERPPSLPIYRSFSELQGVTLGQYFQQSPLTYLRNRVKTSNLSITGLCNRLLYAGTTFAHTLHGLTRQN
ncbi:MAG: hypothetical protein R3B74_08460 [Nitrospirales bacterium]|nr:hypothetical protein [Nitrospirales bacterium]